MAKRRKSPEHSVDKTYPSRPLPPSMQDVIADINSMDDTDILFTGNALPDAARNDGGDSASITATVEKNYEKVMRYLTTHQHLQTTYETLQQEVELTRKVGAELSSSVRGIRNSALTDNRT